MSDPVARKRGRYAIEVGGKHVAPTVTGVLGVLGKNLHFGSAKETALFFVHHPDEWRNLSEAEAVEIGRKHFSGIWKKKADLGTRVHDMAQSWAQGFNVECPPECGPYLDALERFYADYRPEWIEVERSVFREDPDTSFGGTFDAIATLSTGLGEPEHWLLDIKTGRDVWPETDLQLAAYRYADAMGVYDDAGEMIDVDPLPPIDRCGVLHLRDDGSYGLVPLEAGPEQFDVFLSLRRVWAWHNRNTKPIRDKALDAPKKEQVA